MERLRWRAAQDNRFAQALTAAARAQSVEHSLGDREAPLLAREARWSGARYSSGPYPQRGQRVVRDHRQRAMRFVDHPASSTLARDTEEAGAVRARWIDIMIDQRVRCITDPETGPRETR